MESQHGSRTLHMADPPPTASRFSTGLSPLDSSCPMMHGRALLRGKHIQSFSAGAAAGRRDAAYAWAVIESRPPLAVATDQGGRHLKAVR